MGLGGRDRRDFLRLRKANHFPSPIFLFPALHTSAQPYIYPHSIQIIAAICSPLPFLKQIPMSLLFDTPGLAVSSVPVAAFATSSKKRKIATDSSNSNPEEINLDKLMKSMRKLDQSSRGGPVTPVEKVQPKGKGKGKAKVDGVEVEGREKKKQKQETDGLGAQNRGPIRPVPVPASKVVRNDKLPHPAGDHQLKTDTPKKKHKSKGAPSQDSPSALSAEKLAASPSVSVKKPQLYTAPTQNEEAATIETPPQTAMQTQLRAKLAGGRFRMLNETLYTSTGEEARATMKDEGAFNDVRPWLLFF